MVQLGLARTPRLMVQGNCWSTPLLLPPPPHSHKLVNHARIMYEVKPLASAHQSSGMHLAPSAIRHAPHPISHQACTSPNQSSGMHHAPPRVAYRMYTSWPTWLSLDRPARVFKWGLLLTTKSLPTDSKDAAPHRSMHVTVSCHGVVHITTAHGKAWHAAIKANSLQQEESSGYRVGASRGQG